MFDKEKIRDLINIIDARVINYGAEQFDKYSLTDDDKDKLKLIGVDFYKIDSKKYVELAYKWGIISQAIGHKESSGLSWNDLRKWVQRGMYLPLSTSEKRMLEYLNNKAFTHLKDLGNKIGSTIQLSTTEKNRISAAKEQLTKETLKEGVEKRQSLKEIVSEISKKTGDWGRDWGRIVETELHTAFDEGRVAQIIKDSNSEDPKVFKVVYPGACKYCIKLYLTDGIGSQPRIFTISELRNNGNNIGRKQEDWKAIIGATHPFCRCTLMNLPESYKWNKDKRMFMSVGKAISKDRPRVRVEINDRIFFI